MGQPLQGTSMVCDRFLTNSSGRVDTGSTNREGDFSFTQFPAGAWTLSWKAHAAADENAALKKAMHLTVDDALEVQIILPAEMLHAPSEDPQRGVGIYSVEATE